MSSSEQSSLISEFCKVTGAEVNQARSYLEASNWDSSLALSQYFEEEEQEMNERNYGSPKPQPAPQSGNRVTTFASLMNNAENDEEEGQAFYAGGSERSGQQVIGPGKRKAGNEVAEEMFDAVRKFGGEVVDTPSKKSGSLKAFGGSGHVLGSTVADSSKVEGEEEHRPREVRLQLWGAGFTVDDGPMRDYHDPANKPFLDAIRKGEIPRELITRGAEVHLNIEDRTHDEYVPKKPIVQVFSGAGFRLGNITPVVHSNTDESSVESAQASLQVDESARVTNIQIRLADGTRLMMRANYTHTIGDVRRFIVLAHPEFSATVFTLMTVYPTKELVQDESTLEEANLLNAVIVQKIQ